MPSTISNHVIGIRQSEKRAYTSIRILNPLISTSFLFIIIEIVVPIFAVKFCAH